ncbi:hypothetical protein Tco_1563494 [Tanacetum coccineum]
MISSNTLSMCGEGLNMSYKMPMKRAMVWAYSGVTSGTKGSIMDPETSVLLPDGRPSFLSVKYFRLIRSNYFRDMIFLGNFRYLEESSIHISSTGLLTPKAFETEEYPKKYPSSALASNLPR